MGDIADILYDDMVGGLSYDNTQEVFDENSDIKTNDEDEYPYYDEEWVEE